MFCCGKKADTSSKRKSSSSMTSEHECNPGRRSSVQATIEILYSKRKLKPESMKLELVNNHILTVFSLVYCPECGTAKEGELMFEPDGKDFKGEVTQKDGRKLAYHRQAICSGCAALCLKTQKYGWVYLDKKRRLYSLTGKTAQARHRELGR